MGFSAAPIETFCNEVMSRKSHYIQGESVRKKEMDGFTLLIPQYSSYDIESYEAVPGSFEQISEERSYSSYYTPKLITISHQKLSLKVPAKYKDAKNYGSLQLFEDALRLKGENIVDTEQMQKMYHCIVGELSRLSIEKVSIDSCSRKNEIEFKMNLGNGLYVTAMTDKEMFAERVVEFTVAVDGALLIANTMRIDQLCDTLEEIQNEFAAL